MSDNELTNNCSSTEESDPEQEYSSEEEEEIEGGDEKLERKGTVKPPGNLKDEFKKMKEDLLLSVVKTTSPAKKTPSTPVIEYDDQSDLLEALARIWERSASRPYEPPPPRAVRAEVLLDEEKRKELKEAFMLFDLDGDGVLDASDLRGTLLSLGDDIDDIEVRKMLAEGRNPLDIDGFIELLGYRTLELDDEETLLEALEKWDSDKTGYIPADKIQHDLMTWGERFSEQEAEAALKEAPSIVKRGKTLIDYVRFTSKLCGFTRPPKIL